MSRCAERKGARGRFQTVQLPGGQFTCATHLLHARRRDDAPSPSVFESVGDRPTVCGEFGHPDDGIANRAVVARPNDRDVVSNTAAAERRVAASGDERFKVAFLMFPCCHRAGAGSRRLSKLPGRAPDRFFRRAGPVRFQRNLDAPPHGIHSAEIVNFISACSSRVISPRA